MLSNGISEIHCAWILSCSGPRTNAYLIVRPIFPSFRLASLIFFTMFWIGLGLPHPSITCIPQCMCTHPINPKNIHLLHCAHGNEFIRTHDIVRDTFVVIERDVGFDVKWKQLHAFPSNTSNSFRRRIDIVLTKDGIRTLIDVVIVDPTRTDLLPDLVPPKDLLLLMWLKPKNKAIVTNTLSINSSP